MSMFDALGRYGAAIRKSQARRRAVHALNNLPPEIQKDIGWPVSPASNEKATLASIIWSSAR